MLIRLQINLIRVHRETVPLYSRIDTFALVNINGSPVKKIVESLRKIFAYFLHLRLRQRFGVDTSTESHNSGIKIQPPRIREKCIAHRATRIRKNHFVIRLTFSRDAIQIPFNGMEQTFEPRNT